VKGSRMHPPAILFAAIWIIIGLYEAHVLRYNPDVQPWVVGACVVMALITVFSVQMAQQWEKAIVLRFGKLHAIRGPRVVSHRSSDGCRHGVDRRAHPDH